MWKFRLFLVGIFFIFIATLGILMITFQSSQSSGKQLVVIGVNEESLTPYPFYLMPTPPAMWPTPTPVDVNQPTKTATPTPTITPTPTPAAVIKIMIPEKLEKSVSGEISIQLVLQGTPMPELDEDKSSEKMEQLLRLPAAYRTFTNVELAAPAFDIAWEQPTRKPLRSPKNTWNAIIVSDKVGDQLAHISIFLEWKPMEPQYGELYRQLVNRKYTIKVYEPIFTRGQISFLTLVSTLIGSVLSIPFILEVLEKRRKASSVNSQQHVKSDMTEIQEAPEREL